MKRKGKESVQDLENQIIELQRKLDRARKQSSSIWSQLYENLSGTNMLTQTPERVADLVSEVIIDWANQRRDDIVRRASSFRGIPPYTDCLKDLIVSATNPDKEPEIPEMPVEDPSFTGFIDPSVLTSESNEEVNREVASRVPPPPPSQLSQSGDNMRMGPPKMMRVNVPRPIGSVAQVSDSSGQGG